MVDVFLSLSGTDEPFVRGVHAHLPNASTHFYPASFENGEQLISAMEKRIKQSCVFALFASVASAKSHWVKFEVSRAKVQSIVNNKFKVLVFPIDRDLKLSDLPEWMREYWVDRSGLRQKDIARYIREVSSYLESIENPLVHTVGRGELLDNSENVLSDASVRATEQPNIIIFSGLNGIGRRTFYRMFVSHAFRAMPNLTSGPVFELPQFADIEDIYRSIRQELDDKFDVRSFAADLQKFSTLGVEERVEEVVRSFQYYFNLGQAITIVTGNGIFIDRGIIKPWVVLLFEALKGSNGKFFIISHRQAHENEISKHSNVVQFQIPSLKDESIRTIISNTTNQLTGTPTAPSGEVLRRIGGHPAIAKQAARLIAQQGVSIFETNPNDLYNIQDFILSSSVDLSIIDARQLEILSILSWLPKVPGSTLYEVVRRRHNVSAEQYSALLSDLIIFCYVNPVGEDFQISPALRSYFRRRYGYGAPELRKILHDVLREAWDLSSAEVGVRAELMDALAFMVSMEGGTLPPELAPLLLPSAIQGLVKEAYDNGHEDRVALERVVAWGEVVKTLRMDETTREEILTYLVRALVRLGGKDDEVRKNLEFAKTKGYRSYNFLNGFFQKRRSEFQPAIASFEQALRVRKYLRSVVGDLADCYKILGMYTPLRELIAEQGAHIDRNPDLLDIQASMFIAEKRWPEAEAVIAKLRGIGSDDRADCRMASIMMQRDGKFREACVLLTDLLSKAARGRENIRRMRAIAAANNANFEIAVSDMQYFRERPDGRDFALRIEATLELVDGKYDRALQLVGAASKPSAQNKLFEARVYEAQAADILTPLSERDGLRQRAAQIRAQYGVNEEYGV